MSGWPRDAGVRFVRPRVLPRGRVGGVEVVRRPELRDALICVRNVRAAHRIARETADYFVGCALRAERPVERAHCSELAAEWLLRSVRMADEIKDQKRAVLALKRAPAE